MLTDRELTEAIHRGDRDAFAVLVARYQRMVEASVLAATGRPDLIDDVTQDTFITAWRTIDRLRDPDRVRPWLYGIARNLGRKARRRGAVVAPVDASANVPTPFEDVSEREQERAVAAAMATLGATYREPLVLFYYEHCSVKEVASALAVPEDAVMQRLSRGRRKLGEVLAGTLEVTLDSRPSRAALVVGVLAVLPVRGARAATTAPVAAALAGAARAIARAAAVSWRAVTTWIVGRGRVIGAVGGVAIAAAVLAFAVSKNASPVATAAAASTAALPPAATPPALDASTLPRIPGDEIDRPDDDTTIQRNISVASEDPAEGCARSARALVIWVLDPGAYTWRDGKNYYEPSPEALAFADEAAARASDTCKIDKWPELYVACEGTKADLRAGIVTCYPYDLFADN